MQTTFRGSTRTEAEAYQRGRADQWREEDAGSTRRSAFIPEGSVVLTAVTNDKICPEDEVALLVRADQVPDQARVRRRTGEVEYVLRRDLLLYMFKDGGKKAEPVTVEGLFLVSARGHVNQVRPDTLLHWVLAAEDLVDELTRSWRL